MDTYFADLLGFFAELLGFFADLLGFVADLLGFFADLLGLLTDCINSATISALSGGNNVCSLKKQQCLLSQEATMSPLNI